MFSRFCRLSMPDRIAALYVLLYVGWMLLRSRGTPTTIAVATVAFLPLGLAVAWANWCNARTPALDRRTRAGWKLLAASSLSLWFSGTAWTIYLAVFHLEKWPRWVEFFEFSQHLLALAGYLSFPGRWPQRESRGRFVLDISLTVVAGFVLAFYFGLRTSLVADTFTWDYWNLVWSVDWALFVVASVGFLQKRDPTTRVVMAVLLAANTAYLLGNFLNPGEGEGYRPGDAVDLLWFAAWVLRWAAARVAGHRYAREGREPEAVSELAASFQRSAFAYLMVATALTLLVGQVLWGNRQFLALLAVSAGLMVMLLVTRQLLELQENRRLFATQLAQEARFRLLVQGSSDAVLIASGTGELMYVSPSASRLFGPDVVRPGCSLHDLVSPDDRAGLDPIVRAAGNGARRIQVRVQPAGGRPGDAGARDIEIAWSDLRGDPVVRGIVLNCRDVTERNELERQLRHAQKLDAIGHLAGGLAHDFNNVLTAIRGYGELLRIDLGDPEQAREDLRHIEDAVDRASAVTRKLLALSRNQPVQRTVIDLNAVVTALLPLLRQLVTDRIDVRVGLDAEACTVKADQGQIEQVLLNLATNARDAMPNGGRLHIGTAHRTLAGDEPVSLEPGDYAVLVVADEGEGMTPDVRSRIFEPFFSTKPRGRGIGLGLAMVKGIVTDSGGGVEVESAPERGSTFRILLPATREAPLSAASRSGAHSRHGDGPHATVLVVDDEGAVRTFARRMLEQDGYHVVEASDGHEAMRVAARADARIDVLLTDLVMPGLHGTELIAQFRQVRRPVPIVCMTGFAGGDGADVLGLENGVSAILSKPFSADALRRVVAEAIAIAAPQA